MGGLMPSAQSRRMDQKFVARVELSKDQRKSLVLCVKYTHTYFRDCVQTEPFLTDTRFWRRLVTSAKRKKMTPLRYAEKVLLK